MAAIDCMNKAADKEFKPKIKYFMQKTDGSTTSFDVDAEMRKYRYEIATN